MSFKGEIRWNKSKPDGQPRRRLDVSRAEKEFGFKLEYGEVNKRWGEYKKD